MRVQQYRRAIHSKIDLRFAASGGALSPRLWQSAPAGEKDSLCGFCAVLGSCGPMASSVATCRA